MNTEECKQILVNRVPASMIKDWKRQAKIKYQNGTARIFLNTRNNEFYTIVTRSETDWDVLPYDVRNDIGNPRLLGDIVRLSNTIKHCGDYCYVFYHPQRNDIWITLGDADGMAENGHTTIEEIERMFKDIGINQVLVEAENDPDEAEGYIQINGVTGIIVDFEY